ADHGAIADAVAHFARRLLEVHGADVLPAGQRGALEAVRQNLFDVPRALIHRRERSDANVQLRHELAPAPERGGDDDDNAVSVESFRGVASKMSWGRGGRERSGGPA